MSIDKCYKRLHILFKSDFLRNAATVLSGSALAQIIPFVVYPLITRLYEPAELGVFGTYMTLAGAFAVISAARYEYAIMLPSRKQDAFHILILAIGIALILSVTIEILLLVLFPLLTSIKAVSEIGNRVFLIPVSVLFAGFFQSFTFWANRRKHFKNMAFSNIFQSAATSLSKLLLGIFGMKSGGLIIGNISGRGMSSAMLVIQMAVKDGLRHFPVSIKKIRYWAHHYKNFPRYDLAHALVNTLSGNLPILLFTSYFSSAAAGFYSLGISIAFRPLNVFSNAMEQLLSQRIIAKHNDHIPIYADIKKIVRFFILIGVVPFIVFGIFTPQIFDIVFGSKWIEAGHYVRLLLPWLFCVYLVTPLSFIPNIFYRQKKAMIINFFYFGLRLIGLIGGIASGSIYLAVALFSLAGCFIQGYNLWWYLRLVKRNEWKM